jgi:AcrR family transcriptional regulator
MQTERKTQVINEALKLIRANGYHATGMRELAKALGMEAASLYNHIESKEQILQETCFGLAQKFTTALDEVNDIYFNAEEKLRTAIKNHIEILTENLDASYVFLYEWKNLSEPQLSEFRKLRDRYEAGFREIIQTGEDEGLFKESDKKFAALTILSSLNWIIEWYRPEGSKSPKEIAEKLSDFILSGLTKEKVYN